MWVCHSPPRRGQIQRGSNGELLPQRDMQIPVPGKMQPEHVRYSYVTICHLAHTIQMLTNQGDQ